MIFNVVAQYVGLLYFHLFPHDSTHYSNYGLGRDKKDPRVQQGKEGPSVRPLPSAPGLHNLWYHQEM